MKAPPRAAAAVLAAATLSGCTSFTSSTYGQYFDVLKQSVRSTFRNNRVTSAQAASVPYASLGYRINGGDEQLLVLATDSDGQELWTSSTHVVFVTRGGRLIRTVGLKQDLGNLGPASGQSLPLPIAALKGPVTFKALADFPEGGLYSITLECRMTQAGAETITIIGHRIGTVRVNETCEAPALRWHFTNYYWISEADTAVLQSKQHFHPSGDVAEIEVFRLPN